MERSVNYKFTVISGSSVNSNTICNISLLVCMPFIWIYKRRINWTTFRLYFTRIILIYHKRILVETIEEFKRTMLLKNKNM